MRNDFTDWHIPHVPPQHILYLQISGERQVRWGEDIIPVLPGDIVLFGARNVFENPLPTAPYEAVRITFAAVHADGPSPLSNGITISWHTRSKNARLASYFEEIVLGADQTGDPARKRLSHLLAVLLIDLSKDHTSPEKHSRIAFLRENIDRDPGTPRTEASCAAEASISVSTFKRLFLREYGMSLKEYQLRRRISNASAMIASSPKKTFREIALSLGFYDEYHFSRMFRKITGMQPKTYRDTVI